MLGVLIFIGEEGWGRVSQGPGGYSHYGLTGGPVRAKEGQSKNFEKYPQMAVSFSQKPSNGSSRT